MSKFDEYYEYRVATIDDVDSIMQFICDEWGERHILAYDKNLFLWQYGREEYADKTGINMVLMLDKLHKTIEGCIGFIAYSDELENLQISPAITKVRNKGLLPMSGVELIKRQKNIVGEKIQFASGANPNTIVPLLQKVFKHETGVMQQFYMLNPDVMEYKIARIDDPVYPSFIYTDCMIEEIYGVEGIEGFIRETNQMDKMSYKSVEFIRKRYFKHPYYKYRVWKIQESNIVKGILIGREIRMQGNKILRIVDYRGDIHQLSNLGRFLHNMMKEEGYEYIDMMAWPLPTEIMNRAGFKQLDINGSNIIPNYFEPYIQKNIRNYVHRTADVIVFKADGDQDRPSIISETDIL